jgi:diaminohydroxyphosphoribosylaminopyrimidine deaminase/5-amino-6-(5-phosphoribosylamino)uracil reductase
MGLALKKAWEYQLLTYPNPSVGALIRYKNEIIAIEAHQKAGTSHAEVLALLKAYENITKKSVDFNRFNAKKAHDFLYSLPKGFFKETTIFVTLEPCSHSGKTPSCALLLAHLKPKKIVIGTLDPIYNHSGGVDVLRRRDIEVEIGICQKEAKELIEPFLIWQKEAFILFKIAQTSNGKIGGGYLSSKESLTHVHKLRSICTKMIIGGNTVRVDRPTLDCRFIQKDAPNITIFSKKDNFDKNIPLFSVPDREVNISPSLEDLDKPSLILVEGGEGMLNAIKDKIDWLLQYQTPKLSSHKSSYDIDYSLEFIYQDRLGIDLILWNRFSI